MSEQAMTAAEWLLAEFDVTKPDDLLLYDEDADEYTRPHHIQPMFTVKTDMEPGAEMSVRLVDYKDLERWWL